MTHKRARLLSSALALAAVLVLAGTAQAGAVTYAIHADTSAFAGQDGYLDFQFNTGNTPFDPATATLTGFTSDGTLTGALLPDFGDVSGALPGTIAINNSASGNDHTEGFTFGSFFDIFVTLDIPVVSGTASGGDIFALDLLDSDFNPLFGPPAIQIDLDAETGNSTLTNNSEGELQISETPEPAGFLLLGTGLAGILVARRLRIRARG